MRWIIHEKLLSIRLMNPIRNARRGCDDLEIEFPLDPFLNNFHMQQPQKAAPKPETERNRSIRLEYQGRIVQLQFQ